MESGAPSVAVVIVFCRVNLRVSPKQQKKQTKKTLKSSEDPSSFVHMVMVEPQNAGVDTLPKHAKCALYTVNKFSGCQTKVEHVLKRQVHVLIEIS